MIYVTGFSSFHTHLMYFFACLFMQFYTVFMTVTTNFLSCTLFNVTGLCGPFTLYVMRKKVWPIQLIFLAAYSCLLFTLTCDLTSFLTLLSYLSVLTVTTGHIGCAYLSKNGIYNAKY